MKLRLASSMLIANLLAVAMFAQPVIAKGSSGTCPVMKQFDPDNDGTMDLPEAKAAASKLFARLNKDPKKDNTLSAAELKGHMTSKELKAANPDNDGTLDINEYLAEVEKRFNAANPDNDGTIDCKELKTKTGISLLKLLK